MQTIERDRLLLALQARYDHHSAAVLLDEAIAAAGLPVQAGYTPQEVSRIVWTLQQVGERTRAAVMALLALVSEAATHGLPEDPEEMPDVAEDDVAALLPALVDAAMQLRREQLRAGAGNVARAGDAAPEIVPPEKQSMHD